jgi:co-chaperonin GroES (HSP10)
MLAAVSLVDAAKQMTSAEEFPLEPFEDIVIVEQLTEEVTPGGIVIAGKDYKKFPCGKVIAAGPGRMYSAVMDATGHQQIGQFIPNEIKVGDWVIFGRYNSGGEPIEWNGRKFLMCRAGDIGARSKTGEPVKIRLAPTE